MSVIRVSTATRYFPSFDVCIPATVIFAAFEVYRNGELARELVEAKEKVRKVEQKLQRSHIGRLREGLADSIETSNIHQETLRALKQINTAFAQVGYPILHKSGDLLKSRLT